MVRKINVNKIVKDSTSPKKMRDIQWLMKFNPTPQEISVRRVQVYVDEHPLEMVQLVSNEVSFTELLKGYNDYNRNDSKEKPC